MIPRRRFRVDTPLPKRDASGVRAAQILRAQLASGLAKVREDRRLSMESLASSVGMHRNSLREVEEGYANPTLARIGRLADIYGVDITLTVTPRKEPT